MIECVKEFIKSKLNNLDIMDHDELVQYRCYIELSQFINDLEKKTIDKDTTI